MLKLSSSELAEFLGISEELAIMIQGLVAGLRDCDVACVISLESQQNRVVVLNTVDHVDALAVLQGGMAQVTRSIKGPDGMKIEYGTDPGLN